MMVLLWATVLVHWGRSCLRTLPMARRDIASGGTPFRVRVRNAVAISGPFSRHGVTYTVSGWCR